MSFEQLMKPFTIFIEWSRTYKMTLCGHSFSFMDFWMYTLLVAIVIGFLKWMINNS